MADKKVAFPHPNYIQLTESALQAMSRALGAAFLNHQVEQLEKSAASGNWRSRTPNAQSSPKRVQQPGNNASIATAAKPAPRKKTGGVLVIPRDTPPASVRRSMEDEKDADVVVVDASVLVHALHQVKRWCRDGREEVIIVPLEALNTLDLLKKGTSALAQRARAASRILEAQVGTNPRIRVQQDDAFIPWDAIPFSTPNATTAPTAPAAAAAAPADDPGASPEWVRRTVCCARWEVDEAAKGKGATAAAPPRTVCLVVLAPDAPPLSTADGGPLSKHEPRATGTLVAHWAARAGVTVLPVAPSLPNAGANAHGASAAAEAPRRPRSNTNTQSKRGGGGSGIGGSGIGGGGGGKGGSLVERPAAAIAMEGSPRIVRVLARGERLDVGA
ncbi:PINc domain-containing protein [Mycena venus]|uniref:PINc domain-containing protein n=1 Tax=Mycena venus TaxID=2733690 RepID=A0A8H6X5G0_9AGAR|nr:PINc domain-containing protein [Mycena venus]